MPQSWEHIQRLFDEAKSLPPQQREAFLTKACGDDAALRAEVESLLAHHVDAGSGFLEPKGLPGPASPPADDPPADSNRLAPRTPGETAEAAAFGRIPMDSIEGYQITRELHRGGQGVVYQAIQKSTRRKVALKVMLEGPFASEKTKRRFEREVELIASLHHPNIVSVFDTGVSHGKYWFAMDYIRGRPLDQYAAGKDLSVDDALRLFGKICDAVNYAHQRGVIHRDLKPGNIMVDEQGEPHVLDFGLAKVAGAEAFGDTRQMLVSLTGQVVGTLPYMSPEQAKGDPSQIDIRTDVYSLGVILYELLTGKYPYEVVGQMADVLKNIQEAEPRRPSTIRRQIKNELETVLLKALSKDRQRRYQSAAEFSRDIRNYLSGDPIEAKRDSGLYLLKKSLIKHRRSIAAGITILMVVLAISEVFRWRNDETTRQKAASHSLNILSDAWTLARERGDANGAFKKLESHSPAPEEQVSYHLVKGYVLARIALNAEIEKKPELTRHAISEYQNAHLAAGGQRFWDGSALLSNGLKEQTPGSVNALRAAAHLLMLNDWDVKDNSDREKLIDDGFILYSMADRIQSQKGNSGSAAWDPMPPIYDSEQDPLSKAKLRDESSEDARLPVDRNAEVVRIVNRTIDDLRRSEGQIRESRYVTELLFDNLIVLDRDMRFVPNENIVDALVQDPQNPLLWTMTLNRDARWHDDKPFTADDVAFSWRTFIGAENPRLKSVEVAGPHSVRIAHKQLKYPAVPDMNIPVYPHHIWESLATTKPADAFEALKNALWTKPIGNGPYTLDPNSKPERVVLNRWDKYHSDKPAIKKFIFETDSFRGSRARKLASGHADTVEMTAEDYFWHVNGKSFEGNIIKVRHEKYEYDYLCWNLRPNSVLSDPRIRKAIAHAVDVRAIRQFLYCGLYDECRGIFQGQAMADPSIGGDGTVDVSLAKRLVLEARNAASSVSELASAAGREGLVINLLIPKENPLPRIAAKMLREYAEAADLEIRIEEQPYGDCLKVFRKQGGVVESNGTRIVFDGVFTGVQRFGEPAGDADRWTARGEKNYGGYDNPRVNEGFERAMATADSATQGELYREVQRLVVDDQPGLFLWQKPSLWAFNDRLRGVKFSKMGPALFYPGLRAWWVPASSR